MGRSAALAAALAAALGAMVGRLTVGRKKYRGVRAEMEELIGEADRLRAGLAARVDEDAMAYGQVVAAYRLPKSTREERETRQAAIQRALGQAAEAPLATARDAVAALVVASRAACLGSASALSDAGTAAHLARAAFEGAALIVRVNADEVADRDRAQSWLAELDRLREKSEAVFADTLDWLEDRW